MLAVMVLVISRRSDMSRRIHRSNSVSRGRRRFRPQRKDRIEDLVRLMLVGVLVSFCSLIIIRFTVRHRHVVLLV